MVNKLSWKESHPNYWKDWHNKNRRIYGIRKTSREYMNEIRNGQKIIQRDLNKLK